MRYFPFGFFFDNGGSCLFAERHLLYILGFLNSCVGISLLSIAPTINTQPGDVGRLPFAFSQDDEERINAIVKKLIEHSKQDWDSFETSWDFKKHPLVRGVSTVSEAFQQWHNDCEMRYNQVKEYEQQLNCIFLEIYNLQDDLSSEIVDKDINVRKADLYRDVRSLISYAVGCMFGRYSLDVEGLIYAGDEWNAYKYNTFIPDSDNCIPITDEAYFSDDIVGRFVDFVRIVYGSDTLEENLDYIAQALGNKGNTSREIIRNYFLTDFYRDHIRIYQKRPIYWLFDSGKQNGFKALVYMHRWNADTVGNLRVEYLHRMQRVYEKEIERMQDIIDNSKDNREINQASKRREKLVKQLKESSDYDALIAHAALSRVEIDLDDGIRMNYEIVQKGPDGKSLGIMAKI